MSAWEPVIGLEVHAQLSTRTKLFCGCPTGFGAEPNTQVCPVCTGQPGVLPVLNREAFEMALRAAAAANCEIATFTKFDRKNYFYPDLPKAYQISQYDLPLSRAGWLEIDGVAGPRRIRITRIHLEEDAGKLLHHGEGEAGYSLVDLNRVGTPLIEIVSEPDLRSADEAWAYLQALRTLLCYLEVSDGNMEEGSLRCDANVSVRRVGAEGLGTRTEIKNLNSFKHVRDAIAYEVDRQIRLRAVGGEVEQATLLWDADRGETRVMRTKEEAHDYRYFPEPDLTPVRIDEVWLRRVRDSLPELPRDRRTRFISDLGLSEYDAGVLTADRALADYFERVVALGAEPKEAANWTTNHVLAVLNERRLAVGDAPVSPETLVRLLDLLRRGVVSSRTARQDLWPVLLEGETDPAAVVEAKGLGQESDEGALRAVLDSAFAGNEKGVADLLAGKERARGWFVGQAMRATQGKANPQVVNRIIDELLAGRR